MVAKAFDMIVIGAGPGGYVAAIRGAQLGLTVAVVEREHLGGICLNWGCIPTKALLRSAEVFHLMHRAKEFGLKADGIGYDLGAVVQRSRGVAKQLSGGVGHLLKKNKVTVVMGTATLAGDRIETKGIREVFGAHAARLAVSSTKSMHGHLMGATGAVEFIASILALQRGVLPPTAHLRVPDPECDLDYVPNVARSGVALEAVMSNSFAFGGSNAVLVARRA
jgi:pyruvate/2-oxoglutarate dehydrogenase complex dihydrolipoamide dehydrogenase (E3) component